MEYPKVFISYSWHPEANKIKVQQLAERLNEDGVFVVIDIWDLKDGQDKNIFMEKMVNDPDIKKVLLICNKEYAEKANKRQGGVGIESTIVSSEVYANADQTKFIPIIFEKDKNGKAYCPTYVKSRTYIDLSNDDVFENGYDQLLRDIYDKPVNSRPPIGNMPEYLKEDTPTTLPTAHKLKAIKRSIENNSRFLNAYIKDYAKTFIAALSDFKLDYHKLSSQNIIEEIEGSIEKMQPMVKDFISFLNVATDYDICDETFFIEFFESLLQFYSDNDIELLADKRIDYMANDNFRYFNYELFLTFATVMIQQEKYKDLAQVLDCIFLIEPENSRMSLNKCDYVNFQEYNYTLDDLKANATRRVSIVADMLKRHSVSLNLKFPNLIKTDLLLYFLSYLNDHSNETFNHHWYPTLSGYNHQTEILPKLISKKYFEKIKMIFGVNSVEEFKIKISSTKDPRDKLIDGYHYIPTLVDGLSFKNVGTIN